MAADTFPNAAHTMTTVQLVDEARLAEIYRQIRGLVRELDPELSDQDVDAAVTRLFFYAQREKKLMQDSPPPKPQDPSE